MPSETTSSAGRRLGHEAAKVAVRETLSRISESGESASVKAPSLIQEQSLEAVEEREAQQTEQEQERPGTEEEQ